MLCRPRIEEAVSPFLFTSQGERRWLSGAGNGLSYVSATGFGRRTVCNQSLFRFVLDLLLLLGRSGRDLLGMIAAINIHLMTVNLCKKAGSPQQAESASAFHLSIRKFVPFHVATANAAAMRGTWARTGPSLCSWSESSNYTIDTWRLRPVTFPLRRRRHAEQPVLTHRQVPALCSRGCARQSGRSEGIGFTKQLDPLPPSTIGIQCKYGRESSKSSFH